MFGIRIPETDSPEPTTGDGPLAEASRAIRGTIVTACTSAAVIVVFLGLPAGRRLGPDSAASPVEIDATVAAWLAEAEDRRLDAWGRPCSISGRSVLIVHRAPDGLLDLNAAAAAEIAVVVPGVGDVLAERLVAARPVQGWRDWTDIEAVDGIGPSRLAALKEHARLVPR